MVGGMVHTVTSARNFPVEYRSDIPFEGRLRILGDHHRRLHDAMRYLAAGYGTRIGSLFPDTPKALIEVGGRALIDHVLANLAARGRSSPH